MRKALLAAAALLALAAPANAFTIDIIAAFSPGQRLRSTSPAGVSVQKAYAGHPATASGSALVGRRHQHLLDVFVTSGLSGLFISNQGK